MEFMTSSALYVRKTYDTMLPVSLTETCLPWKLHIGCNEVSTLPQKHYPVLFAKTFFNLKTAYTPPF